MPEAGGAKPPGPEWTTEAAQRILQVPAGFMRSRAQERIEELARERAAAAIDLALVEEGIEIGRRMMAETSGGNYLNEVRGLPPRTSR